MRILIAPDSYKNALSALEVATSLKAGLEKVFREAEFEILPMADGGEGTVEALIDATQGQIIKTTVHDPFMRPVESSFGITGDGITAVIEMASASGIQLITSEERNPWITTTFGTGELIHAALDKGCRDIILGIGGSATNDCGMGMAAALGVKFLDAGRKFCWTRWRLLAEVARIDMSGLDKRIKDTTIMVACDVTNPLTGPKGASHIYGPQKGADPDMVKRLDSNLKQFSDLIAEQLGKHVERSRVLVQPADWEPD